MSKAHKAFVLISTLLAATPLMAAFATPGVATAGTREATSMEARNKAAVEQMLKAWMAGDGSVLQRLLSDDIEWTITGNSAAAGTTRGMPELMSKVLGPFGARFSQSSDRFRPRAIDGIYADGDVVIAQFRGAGTTNTGRLYENNYVWLLTMRDGKVVRGTAFFDSIAFDALWQQTPPASN